MDRCSSLSMRATTAFSCSHSTPFYSQALAHSLSRIFVATTLHHSSSIVLAPSFSVLALASTSIPPRSIRASFLLPGGGKSPAILLIVREPHSLPAALRSSYDAPPIIYSCQLLRLSSSLVVPLPFRFASFFLSSSLTFASTTFFSFHFQYFFSQALMAIGHPSRRLHITYMQTIIHKPMII